MKKKIEDWIIILAAASVWIYCVSRMLIEGVQYW